MKYQNAKLNLTVMISRIWGFYAAVCKIKNFSKLWINLVDEAFSASFVRFLSKFIVQDDYCLFYSSISYAQFTGTRMWCTELHFVTHVSHALVILFTILQMNWPGNRRWCVMGWLHYILWKCGMMAHRKLE